MNISSIGGAMFSNTMQATRNSQQSLSTNSLKNGDTLAIIETKYKVRVEDVSKLVDKQVSDFRKLFPMFNDYKIVLGIGGMSFENKSEDEAKEKGVGIIKIVGDNVEYYTEGIKAY